MPTNLLCFLNPNFFDSKAGIYGLFSATTLVYFAFIGFENLVNISEEVKNPKKVIPKALLISLLISAIIYILVSISTIGILGADTLASSKAPIAEASENVIPKSSVLLSLIALFATSNTVLISIIVASRLLYGLSINKLLPPMFSYIGRHGTPYISVFCVGVIASISLFIGSIDKLAHLVDFGIFIVYIFINLAAIILRFSESKMKRGFHSPINIGRFPVLALLGLLLNLAMMYFFSLATYFYAFVLCIAGLVLYFVFNKN